MSSNYLIIGDDEYLKSKELAGIKRAEIPGENAAGFSSFTADDIEQIMDEAGTAPLFSEKRFLLVRVLEDFGEAALKTIIDYLQHPSPSTVMVMTAGANFKKKKAFGSISKLAEVIRTDPPSGARLKEWIRVFFRKHGIQITADAVELVVELKGNDSVSVKNALEKLLDFSGGEAIDAGVVERVVGRSVTENIFKLADAIDAGDARHAFAVRDDLYREKKTSYEIIGYLSWFLRTMQSINFLKIKGLDAGAIAGELGYSQGYTRRLMNQARKYPPERIKKWQALLLQADMDSKTGRFSSEVAIDMLLARLV